MRIGRFVAAVLGAGLLAATACNTTPSNGDDDDTTTTSSGTGTGGGCGVDLVTLLGATTECNDCCAQSCCAEAQSFQIAKDAQSYAALVGCAIAGGAGPCASSCSVQVCDGGVLAVFVFSACGECVSANCCPTWSACEAETSCLDTCLLSLPSAPESCCADVAFVALDECAFQYCPEPCGAKSCGAAGSGGSAGSGGA